MASSIQSFNLGGFSSIALRTTLNRKIAQCLRFDLTTTCSASARCCFPPNAINIDIRSIRAETRCPEMSGPGGATHSITTSAGNIDQQHTEADTHPRFGVPPRSDHRQSCQERFQKTRFCSFSLWVDHVMGLQFKSSQLKQPDKDPAAIRVFFESMHPSSSEEDSTW